jgi:folate-binding Fe-S cluster repair protein YgfZ
VRVIGWCIEIGCDLFFHTFQCTANGHILSHYCISVSLLWLYYAPSDSVAKTLISRMQRMWVRFLHTVITSDVFVVPVSCGLTNFYERRSEVVCL